MSNKIAYQSIRSLVFSRKVAFGFLAFVLLIGVLTEIPYGLFQWNILSKSLMLLRMGEVLSRKIIAPLLVPFDIFIQIFLLTPIKSAKEISEMSFKQLSAGTVFVFLLANFWYFTNFMAEALGIAGVASGAVKTGLMWLDFPFAMGCYNLLFTQEIFLGLRAWANKMPNGKPSPFYQLFNKTKSLFFLASLMLLANIADWAISAFYTGINATGEVLGHPEWSMGFAIFSAVLSGVFTLINQMPETFGHFAEPLDREDMYTRRGMLGCKLLAGAWSTLIAGCFGFLCTNALLGIQAVHDSKPATGVVIAAGALFSVALLCGVYKAAHQNFVNQYNDKDIPAADDLIQGQSNKPMKAPAWFSKFLLASLIISMVQRRLQTIEFNTETFAKIVGGQENSVAWMIGLSLLQAPSYSFFLWKRVKEVTDVRYEQLRSVVKGTGAFMGNACNYFVLVPPEKNSSLDPEGSYGYGALA